MTALAIFLAVYIVLRSRLVMAIIGLVIIAPNHRQLGGIHPSVFTRIVLRVQQP